MKCPAMTLARWDAMRNIDTQYNAVNPGSTYIVRKLLLEGWITFNKVSERFEITNIGRREMAATIAYNAAEEFSARKKPRKVRKVRK